MSVGRDRGSDDRRSARARRRDDGDPVVEIDVPGDETGGDAEPPDGEAVGTGLASITTSFGVDLGIQQGSRPGDGILGPDPKSRDGDAGAGAVGERPVDGPDVPALDVPRAHRPGDAKDPRGAADSGPEPGVASGPGGKVGVQRRGEPGRHVLNGDERRTHIARSAYIAWLATPPGERAPEIQTLTKFCDEFRTTIPELAGFEAEPGFMDKVVADRTHWNRITHRVISAVLRNAENPEHKDQLVWTAAYLAIVGHPAAADLEALSRPK